MSTDTHFIASHMQIVKNDEVIKHSPTERAQGLSDSVTTARRKYCAQFALGIYGQCLARSDKSVKYCRLECYDPAFSECINNKDL